MNEEQFSTDNTKGAIQIMAEKIAKDIDEKTLEKLNKEFFGFTVAQIDEDLGRYIMKCSDLEKEKQDLIKWIKHNIKIYENRVMEHGFDDDIIILNMYQNVLDKIKEGNYE